MLDSVKTPPPPMRKPGLALSRLALMTLSTNVKVVGGPPKVLF
jgi:hypothetical protein